MIIPILVTITHLIWVFSWWMFGHCIFLLAKGCTIKTCSFSDHSSEDFLGGIFGMLASYSYIYIGHKVINAIYKGELPDGSSVSNIEKVLQNIGIQMNGNRKTRRNKKE